MRRKGKCPIFVVNNIYFGFPKINTIQTALLGSHSVKDCATFTTHLKEIVQNQRAMMSSGDLNISNKPYKCSFCSKNFSKTDYLKQHLKIHSGENPFSCLQCDKKFTQKCTLKNHERIHTGERLFSCSLCDNTFTSLSNLKRHERSHERETIQLQSMWKKFHSVKRFDIT